MIHYYLKDAPLVLALGALLAVVILQRVIELMVSARHVVRLRALGAREHASGHFPWIVLVHVLFPLLLVAEVLTLDARPGSMWFLWLAVWLGAQWLRYSAVSALGTYWTVGIWVVPDGALVRTGPYRYLKHPNYLAVVLELLAAPLLFGAWRTALVIGVFNLIALHVRVRAEEDALLGVEMWPSTARSS